MFLGTKEAILAMERYDPPGGTIINPSSIEGLVGAPNLGANNDSKQLPKAIEVKQALHQDCAVGSSGASMMRVGLDSQNLCIDGSRSETPASGRRSQRCT